MFETSLHDNRNFLLKVIKNTCLEKSRTLDTNINLKFLV